MTTHHAPDTARTPAGTTAGVHSIAPWLAGVWAAAYLGLALLHLLRDTGASWVTTPASVLGSLSSAQVSVLIVALATLGLGGLALRGRAPRPAGTVLAVTGLVVALVLADARSLTFLGYLPMVLLGTLGIGPADDVALSVLTPALTSVGESVGGLALVITGLTALRRARADTPWSTLSARSAARVGRGAVAVAVVVPAFYALTRLAWALDIPFGVRDAFLVELGSGKYAGLGLSIAALVGCLLTVGLTRPWGERFWSWLPVVGGRPVPVGMALVPAVFVGSVVFSAGLAFWRLLLVGRVSEVPGAEADWAAWLPELFWPFWGLALAVAALAYRARRAAA